MMLLSTLGTIGIEPSLNPTMQLITTAELQSIPHDTKQNMRGRMSDLADILSENKAMSAEVMNARLFYRKQTGYVALSLAVKPKLGEERKSITTVLEQYGVDTKQDPYKNYRYTVILASCMGYPPGVTKQEIFDAINATYPRHVELDTPTF